MNSFTARWQFPIWTATLGLAFIAVALTLSYGVLDAVGGGLSLNNAVRAFLPFSLVAGGFTALLVLRSGQLPVLPNGAGISLRQVLLLLPLGLLIAISPLPYIGNFPHFGGLLIVVAGYVAALVLTVIRSDSRGLIAYMLLEPFISYVETDLASYMLPSALASPGTLSSIGLVIFTAVTLLSRGLAGVTPLVRTRLDKYVLGFTFILLLSSIASPDPGVSLAKWLRVGLVMPLYFFLITSSIRTRADVLPFAVALVIRGVLRSFMVFYLSLGLTGYDLESQLAVHGLVLNRQLGPQAMTITLALPLAISLAVVFWRSRVKAALSGLAALFLLGMAIDTQIRTLLIALVLPIPLLLTYRRGKRVMVGGLAVLGAIALISGKASTLFVRFDTLGSTQGWSNEMAMRIDGWGAALRMMIDHPLLGIGLDMWPRFVSQYAKLWMWGNPGNPIYVYITSAHQLFLNYGAEAGILAMLLLIIITIIGLVQASKLLRKTDDEAINAVATGLVWIILSLAISLSTGGTFGEREMLDHGFAFWVPLGLVMALQRIAGVVEGQVESCGVAQRSCDQIIRGSSVDAPV